MATRPRRTRRGTPTRSSDTANSRPDSANSQSDRAKSQSDSVMELIREGTALQIELLGAAARVWSEIVERVANYNRELTNELMEFSGGNRTANDSLENLVEKGRKHVADLMELPAAISKNFAARVNKRSGRAGHPTA